MADLPRPHFSYTLLQSGCLYDSSMHAVPLCCALCSLVAFPAGRSSIPVTMKASKPVNEFSRTIGITSLGRKANRNLIEASDEECAALAKRFDLISIGTLAANVSLAIVEPRRTRVRTYGSFTATEVVQRSVMDGNRQTTLQLEKMPFETFFIDEEMADDAGGSYDSDVDESYDEYIEEGQIDMGELVAQHLYLALSDRQQVRTAGVHSKRSKRADSRFPPFVCALLTASLVRISRCSWISWSSPPTPRSMAPSCSIQTPTCRDRDSGGFVAILAIGRPLPHEGLPLGASHIWLGISYV